MDKIISAWKNAVTNNYANFSGRLSVGGYWWFFLANILIAIPLFILSQVSSVFLIFYFLFALAMLVPGLAAAIRRLHDTGKSGWLLLISFVPFIGTILLIVFLASSGEPGQNAYGPPPASV